MRKTYPSKEDHLTIFKEIVFDLEIIKVKYNEENLGLNFIVFVASSYMTFKYTILDNHDTYPG